MDNQTSNNAVVQDVLSRAAAAIKDSETAIQKSDQLLASLELESKKIEEDNQRAQEAIDKDIIRTVQDMDEDTANFVLNLEE